MILDIERIDCTKIRGYENSNRSSPFWIGKLIFNYKSSKFDSYVLNMIRSKGDKLALNVYSGAANISQETRDADRIRSNTISGLLSEYAWKLFLNSASFELLVKETMFIDTASQIDLETILGTKTIEVRSSFPRNGINFAICHQTYEFDILGPYSNSYKPQEPQKDFYLRTLYHVNSPIDFLSEYQKDGFTVYLTGGATWEMMVDDKISKDKTLLPEDSVDIVTEQTEYRVVPFSKALDTHDMLKLILSSEKESRPGEL
jgi:hypothetical protein